MLRVKVSWVKSLKDFKPTSISELHFKEIRYRCLKIKLSFWSSNDEDSGTTVFCISRSLKRKCKTKGRAGENSNKWECHTKKEEEEEFSSCVLQAME